MKTYLDCWAQVARDLFAQALAGEPELTDALPKPLEAGSFGFAATIQGDEEGRFAVEFDGSILEAPLLGDGVDQKAGWGELLRETCDAAAGELLVKTGKKCRVTGFEQISGEAQISRAFQLKSGERVWTVLVHDEVRAPRSEKPAAEQLQPPSNTGTERLRHNFIHPESQAGLAQEVNSPRVNPRRPGSPCPESGSRSALGNSLAAQDCVGAGLSPRRPGSS